MEVSGATRPPARCVCRIGTLVVSSSGDVVTATGIQGQGDSRCKGKSSEKHNVLLLNLYALLRWCISPWEVGCGQLDLVSESRVAT